MVVRQRCLTLRWNAYNASRNLGSIFRDAASWVSALHVRVSDA